MKKSRVLSLLVALMMFISVFPCDVLASEVYPPLEVNGVMFEYDEDINMYVHTSEYGAHTYLLYQENIVNGQLPNRSGSYVLMEDIKVTAPTEMSGGFCCYHNGKTLTYEPEDPNDYMITVVDAPNSYASFYYTARDVGNTVTGKIVSENGAPLVDFAPGIFAEMRIENVEIDGGKNTSVDNDNISMYEDDTSFIRINAGCDIDITNCEVYNCAAEEGAFISNSGVTPPYGEGGIAFINSIVHDCYAVNGGVTYTNKALIVLASNSSMYDNCAKENGGAICIEGRGRMEIESGTITNNFSGSSKGGGVYIHRSAPEMEIYDGYGIGIRNKSEVTIVGNVGANQEANNVYLDCEYYNEGKNNTIGFMREPLADINIGISFDPNYPPRTLIYPLMGESEISDISGFKADDPSLVIVRNDEGLFVACPKTEVYPPIEVNGVTFEYDEAGNMTSMRDREGVMNWYILDHPTMEYDTLGNIVEEVRYDNGVPNVTRYIRDDHGNWTRRILTRASSYTRIDNRTFKYFTR